MKIMRVLALLPVLALGACASNSYCLGEQKYQNAGSVPPLRPIEGLKLPESPSALKIPPAPANPVAFGERYKDEDGDEKSRCLDKPPAMPALPVKSEESKPEEQKPAPKPEEKPG